MEQPSLRSARARCPSTEDTRRGCSGVTRGDGRRFSSVLWRIQGICDFPVVMHRSLGSGECFVTKFLPPHRLWILRKYVLHSSTRERRALLVPEAPLQSLEDKSRLVLVKLIYRRPEEPRLKVLVIRPPGPIQQRQDRLRRSLLIKLPRYLYEEDRQRARRI